MAKRKATLTICWRCDEILTGQEILHHAHLCDGCALREHDSILLVGRDPNHPEAEWLRGGPVDLDLPPRLSHACGKNRR